MTEWLYKAREVPRGERPRPDYETTRAFAVKDGILCRSAYTKKKAKKDTWIANVKGVAVGDTIHLFFRRHGAPEPDFLGSFSVQSPGAARLNADCDLALVQNGDLERRLREAYKMTSQERVMGWLLTPTQGAQTPAVDEPEVSTFLHQQPTLVRYSR